MLDKKYKEIIDTYTLVIYDGMCGFCDTSIQFILENKPSNKLRFVAFQSEIGQQLLHTFQIEANLDSIVLIENRRYYKKAKAFLKILNYVNSPLNYLKYFRFIPTGILNLIYDIIAKNRYKLMAQKCRIVSEKERAFFLQ
ncbi:thiol-disulfide oxidoreductase DCC family protein [Flavobacterium sp. J27]|uniref:thiol-disulfide oxidoreductase DCC family protein n=1 Tax=Flavobacterium sp. J27 TaxID=2060419 RepID=UPI00102F7628|nr:DCC1-like thiol-disulfide oxidoreductase family protein [Flavobacterium sp. J27]